MTYPAGPVPWTPPPAPAPPPRSDSTRTIAITALVLSLVALASFTVMQVLPMLFIGVLGGLDGGPSIDDGSVGGFGGTTYEGSAAHSPDGSVQPEQPAAAVTDAIQDWIPGPVSCETTTHAVAGAATLCRAGHGGESWYAVVRFTTDSGDFEAMTFMYGDG